MSITDLQQKRGLIIGGLFLFIALIVVAITLVQTGQQQEVRQRAAEPVCPAQGGSCEWDVDASVVSYHYKIVEEGNETSIAEGDLKNPQIDTNTPKTYEIRTSCTDSAVNVFWTKPTGETANLYDFTLYDVTDGEANAPFVGRKTAYSNLSGQGSQFMTVDGGRQTTTVFAPTAGSKYTVEFYTYPDVGQPRSEVLARITAFSCPSQTVKLKATFTPLVNKKYTCTVTATNACGTSAPASVDNICTAATPTPTAIPTVTLTPTSGPTATPTITPTPAPLTCGAPSCSATQPCASGLTCVQAGNGTSYCSMPTFQDACRTNPSGPTCCSTPTPTPTRTPTPTNTPTPTLVVTKPPVPTTIATPTPTPTNTPTPTSTPIPTQIALKPTAPPQPTIAPTGDSFSTTLLVSAGVVATIIGALFFFAF